MSKTPRAIAAASIYPMPPLHLPWVTGSFGISGYSYGCGDHTGLDAFAIDFGLPLNTPVAAVAEGFAYSGTNPPGVSYGTYVWIVHTLSDGLTPDGYVSLYGHLNATAIPAFGQFVKQGQIIGFSGYSGNVIPQGPGGAHLHFSLRGNNATSLTTGSAQKPEPMSGFTGFGKYGNANPPTCNYVPSPKYTSSHKTLLEVESSLDAIGTDTAHGNNNNPLYPQQNIEVKIRNTRNTVVVDKYTTTAYSTTTGTFIAALDLGSTWVTGSYLVQTKVPITIRQQVSGTPTIKSGTINYTPSLYLPSGDINNDNVVDILDYNIWLSCGNNQCTPAQMVASDLNMNGVVGAADGVDYNIILRNFGKHGV